jgi:hypothetical protein
MAEMPPAAPEFESSSEERCTLVEEIDDMDEFQDVATVRAGGRL